MRGKEEKKELAPSVCVPKIIGQGYGVNEDTGEAFEYDELNCDTCTEIDCINWLNAHSQEEYNRLAMLLEELKESEGVNE